MSGAGTGGDPVVKRLERVVDQRVVAVEEDDVLAPGVAEGGVARGGGRTAARLGEHLDARIPGGDLAHDVLRPVRRGLDDGKKLPVRERLFLHGAEAFAHVRLHVAAGNDYGKERLLANPVSFLAVCTRRACGAEIPAPRGDPCIRHGLQSTSSYVFASYMNQMFPVYATIFSAGPQEQ